MSRLKNRKEATKINKVSIQMTIIFHPFFIFAILSEKPHNDDLML